MSEDERGPPERIPCPLFNGKRGPDLQYANIHGQMRWDCPPLCRGLAGSSIQRVACVCRSGALKPLALKRLSVAGVRCADRAALVSTKHVGIGICADLLERGAAKLREDMAERIFVQ